MNGCPYYLIADPSLSRLQDLKGRTVACREAPRACRLRGFSEYRG